MGAAKTFYWTVSLRVQINGEESDNVQIKVVVRKECVRSPWWFNVFMDGVVKEKDRVCVDGEKISKVLTQLRYISRIAPERRHQLLSQDVGKHSWREERSKCEEKHDMATNSAI